MSETVLIIGGGIVGLATALEVQRAQPGRKVCVLEKEARVGTHQTGHNSGVIHSGIYYKPGSAKAQTCVAGARRMVEFCREHNIPHQITGKVVVATQESELPVLAELFRRAQANGVPGVAEIGPERLREIEPHARGIKALWVPGTGIVNFAAVAAKYAELIQQVGGEVHTGARVTHLLEKPDGWVAVTSVGEFSASQLINCAGLFSDRVARLAGATPTAQIVPFRGEYYQLNAAGAHLVKGLIYPVPDSRFPFLGVHFTRMIDGGVECGPNAVMALKREGYGTYSFSPSDCLELARSPGVWRLALKYWRTGCGETWRSLNKSAFTAALQKLIPELRAGDLQRGGSGVRAQAVLPDGTLVDDFQIVREARAIHVLNAPSPAATASLAIGAQIAKLLD